jgi:hypothetical protein
MEKVKIVVGKFISTRPSDRWEENSKMGIGE